MTAPGDDQTGMAIGDRHRQPGGHRGALTGPQDQFDSCLEIDGGITRMGGSGSFHLWIEEFELNFHLIGASGRMTGRL
jgi:hypothetical protein